MAKKKSIHIRKDIQIILVCLVIAWILQAIGFLGVAPYAVSIIIVLAVALIWK